MGILKDIKSKFIRPNSLDQLQIYQIILGYVDLFGFMTFNVKLIYEQLFKFRNIPVY